MTQETLAERSGVRQTTISQLELGNNKPQRSTLRLLSQGLGLSQKEFEDFLFSGKPLTTTVVPPRINKNLARPANFPDGKIPVVGVVPGGSGRGIADFNGVWAEDFVDQGTIAGPNSYAAVVVGDSMAPTFREGVMLIADPDVVPNDGDVVIVQLDGSGNERNTVKRYFNVDDKRMKLVSDNPRHEPMIVERETVAWMGTCVEERRRLR